MLLTLSPFSVDSVTPSYRHSQHPPRAPIPHQSPLLSASPGQELLYMYVQAHPGSRQHLIHAPFPRLSPPPLPHTL